MTNTTKRTQKEIKPAIKAEVDSYGYAGSERGGIHIQECKDGH